ncbi:hypothetical protein [Massilia aerilata]|uniref:Uncharacterized protein n=1 Tax=Massilia aerilata TaxID=453817 RepID=A0ABW0S1J4_9BURK
MVKTAYPGTQLQPVQTLDFILENGLRAGAVFLPQPDSTGTLVQHVAIAFVHAGSPLEMPVPAQRRPQTILDAATLAFAFAQSESARVGSAISSVRLLGQEFLEESDVLQITNGKLKVDVV